MSFAAKKKKKKRKKKEYYGEPHHTLKKNISKTGLTLKRVKSSLPLAETDLETTLLGHKGATKTTDRSSNVMPC